MRVSPSLGRLVPTAGILLVAACGGSDEGPVGPDPEPAAGPALAAEPPFTPGTANSLHWSPPEAPAESRWEYLVQRAAAPDFGEILDRSGWIPDTTHTFTDLAHGLDHHFRVRARSADGALTAWSVSVSSVQDGRPPAVAVDIPDTAQTSLLFDIDIAAGDPVSGLAGLVLWVRIDGGDLVEHGSVPVGEYAFQADRGGRHEFHVAATDRAGNRRGPGGPPLAVTRVPEPIIIHDVRGEAYDITNAVLKHGIHQDAWEHGLGRDIIQPVIDPVMIGPGHPRYPSDDNLTEVCAVTFDGDHRAYPLGDIANREVVNDTPAGVPLAACY
jgi:hypothetical protein